MSHPHRPVDQRDERAADRDDAADHRDDITRDRDGAADQRDSQAAERDDDARDDSADLAALYRRTCRKILERFARVENVTIDTGDWPDLTPAVLVHLEAHTAEQRRLAGLDREAVADLLDQLQRELGHLRREHGAAARDRDASARDRQHSAGNRHDSVQDRDLSAGDRGQAAIEREQAEPDPGARTR